MRIYFETAQRSSLKSAGFGSTMKALMEKKQKRAKHKARQEWTVLFLVWLLLFQLCTPTLLPAQHFDAETQVTCEITHLDEALPASFLVRPVPVTIGQGVLLRNSHSSALFSFTHTIFRTSCSTLFASAAEMRLGLSSAFLHAQLNRPLRI